MTLDLGFAGLRMALNRTSHAHKEALLSFLTPTALHKYHSLPTPHSETFKDFSLSELIDKIDPSWFEEGLGLFSHDDQIFYLSAFPEKARSELLKRLGLDTKTYVMQKGFADFALRSFFDTAFGGINCYTPLSLLGSDKFLVLTTASKGQLMLLCRYLGLYDLIYELKRVLRGAILKNLEKALTNDELSFLSLIQKERSVAHFMDIGLNHWDGNVEVLLDVLLKRGINRLAKALYTSSDALVWYITHTLDKNTAFTLSELRCDLKNPQMVEGLREQVFNTWKRICTISL